MQDWTPIISIISAIISAGAITSLFTLRQKRDGAKIDNAKKLVDEYTELLEQYKKHDLDQQSHIATLNTRITELESRYSAKVAALESSYESQLATIRTTYGARIAELEQQNAEQAAQLAQQSADIARLRNELTHATTQPTPTSPTSTATVPAGSPAGEPRHAKKKPEPKKRPTPPTAD